MDKSTFFEKAGRTKKAIKIAVDMQAKNWAIGTISNLSMEQRMALCADAGLVSYPSDETWDMAVLIHRAMSEEGLRFTPGSGLNN